MSSLAGGRKETGMTWILKVVYGYNVRMFMMCTHKVITRLLHPAGYNLVIGRLFQGCYHHVTVKLVTILDLQHFPPCYNLVTTLLH